MNKKQIESVATEYIHLDKTHGLTRKKAFKDGARWVLETLCELPLDAVLRELAEYDNERIGGSPWADHLASRMMQDSLGKSAWHGMNEKPDGMFVILVDFGSEDGQEEYSFGVSLDGMESGKRWAYVRDLLPSDAKNPSISEKLNQTTD